MQMLDGFQRFLTLETQAHEEYLLQSVSKLCRITHNFLQYAHPVHDKHVQVHRLWELRLRFCESMLKIVVRLAYFILLEI